MSEKDLNIEYICEKTLLNKDDELVPIILDLIQESYKAGLCQAEFDNTMNLIEETQELKKKYVNAVADYVHKDTLTATDYVELNKDNELLMSYNQALLKENNELKKQLDKAHDELYSLKNKYNIRLLNQISENIEPDCEDYYLAEIETKAHKYDLTQNQQKEFINYLEKEIKRINPKILDDGELNLRLDDIKYTQYLTYKEILQKYKEIIGGNK